MTDFRVIEFRRYTITSGECANFCRYFETYFPEAFEQLGAIIFGHFVELGHDSTFTWIRGFQSMDDRASVNRAFYSGPLWKAHGPMMNARLIDHTNVLLLEPLAQQYELAVMPAVDPVHEPQGAQGIVIAQIFAPASGREAEFSDAVQSGLPALRGIARELGLLRTLHAADNFPSLPFRTDGDYVVWLGVVADEEALAQLHPLLERHASALEASGLFRAPAESVVLEPGMRSRLRWM